MKLPDYRPTGVQEISCPDGFVPKPRGGSVYPELSKLPDGRLVLDHWRDGGGKIVLRVWAKADHPGMELLPSNAPRAVKRLYRGDWQLSFLRMTDAGPFLQAQDEAMEAWEKFCANQFNAKQERSMTPHLVPQSYGIAMAQCTFGGPRGVWLECTTCPVSDRIAGVSADISNAKASGIFRKGGWTGRGPAMLGAKCPKCSANAERTQRTEG